MADDEGEITVPFVVAAEVGTLPEDAFVVKMTFATSEERFKAKQYDTAYFGMSRRIAVTLGATLLREAGELPGAGEAKN